MHDETTTEPRPVERRSLIGQFGGAAATVLAAGAAATGAAVVSSAPATAQGVTDADILNFALNLEYLRACCTIAFGNVVMACFGAFRC